MDAAEILKGLDSAYEEEGIPRGLLRAAVDQREAVTPGLIAALDEVAANPGRFYENGDQNLYFWAVYLLAYFQEPAALPAMLRLFKVNNTEHGVVVSDLIAFDGPILLANLAGENIQAICELLRDKSSEELNRQAAAEALGLLCHWGRLKAESLIEEFRPVLETLQKKDELLAATMVNTAADLNIREFAPDITRAYEAGLLEKDDLEYTAAWLHDPDFEPPPPLMHLRHSIDDIVEFFEEKQREQEIFDRQFRSRSDATETYLDAGETVLPYEAGFDFDPTGPLTEPGQIIHSGGEYRPSPKVGRNDPCPCGSGKKFKKCCGA